MMKMWPYKVRYARLVILERTFDASSLDEAYRRAEKMVEDDTLGVLEIESDDGSTVKEVCDYDKIWEVDPL